jgi:NAD-dependent SIR2 family protein deacetylase
VLSPDSLQHAAELVEQADLLVIAAGAGMGVDSGLPDFCGREGFWNAYPALARAGIDFYAAANPARFAAAPRQAWGFYGHRLALYRKTRPHAGFAILQRWAARTDHGAIVYTSNVDGQFQAAGVDDEAIWECHGSLRHLQCSAPCGDEVWSAEGFEPAVDEARCELTNELPLCPRCGALARPNVLMFGDAAWVDARERAQANRVAPRLAAARRPLVIELGAGTAVPSVRIFGQHVLQRLNGRLLRINPRESGVPSGRDVGIAAGALDALRAVDARLAG